MALALGELPQDCVVCILSKLKPRDVCRLALVNRSFMLASRADAIWDALLPPRYEQTLLPHADDCPLEFASKKAIYDRLCQGISLHKHTQNHWLDQATGGSCCMISARALSIVWGSDPRYWEWCSQPGSRFLEVAYLRNVCWFHVSGSLKLHLHPGAYTVSFRLKFVEPNGWEYKPVECVVSTTNGQLYSREIYFNGSETTQLPTPNLLHGRGFLRRFDRDWMDYDVGDFMVTFPDDLMEVEFSMLEIKGLHWKSGLLLEGVVIRPSYLPPYSRLVTES